MLRIHFSRTLILCSVLLAGVTAPFIHAAEELAIVPETRIAALLPRVVNRSLRALLGADALLQLQHSNSSRQNSERRPRLDLPAGTVIKRDLVYRQVNGHDLRLDLYLPPRTESLKPLVVWIHGGAWRAGDKDRPRSAVQLLPHGFAVASINYRLSQVAKFPAQIEDCKAAVRWLRVHAQEHGIDPDRFGVWGSSAGGHLVALLGTSTNKKEWDVGEHLQVSSAVQAVCDWFGPTDFLRMDDQPGTMVHLSADSPESQLIGGDVREHPDRVAQANPITTLTRSCPPFLIMHGREDRTVIPSQSVLLHEALQKAGVSSRLILLDNAGHGGRGFDGQVEVVAEFFASVLRGP